MTIDWTQVVVTFLTSGAVSVLGTLLALWVGRRKAQAQAQVLTAKAEDTQVNSASRAVDIWEQTAEWQKGEVLTLRAMIKQIQEEAEQTQAVARAANVRAENAERRARNAEWYMAALEYLSEEVRGAFPVQVQIARDIATGKLQRPTPGGPESKL